MVEVQGQLRKYFDVGKFLSLILQGEGARRKRKCFIVADPFVHVRTKTKKLLLLYFFHSNPIFVKRFSAQKKNREKKQKNPRSTHKRKHEKVLLFIHNFFYLHPHSHHMKCDDMPQSEVA